MAALTLVAACGNGDDDSPAGSDAVGSTVPGVEHVHGLGVDPGDGSLYVATHFGTFRIAGDDAERVGESYQDTMGFTVAGPGRFLGSGHPDLKGMQAGQPGLLGLIESTDGGATWTSLSLAGEADFHGLAYAHDRVYGWSSSDGTFMVTEDMRTWETRSTLDLYSFAVDPDDEGHILGATPSGLVESMDEGATWTPVNGPALVALSWDREVGVLGATEDGTVHVSEDGGTTWTERGSLPGAPQAVLATTDALWAAAHDDDERTGIYRSGDGGRTWDLRYRDPDS